MSSDIVFGLLQPGRKLEPRYRELAILRNAIVGDCKFEYSRMEEVPGPAVNVQDVPHPRERV